MYAEELQDKGQEPLGLLRATAVAVGAFVQMWCQPCN